MNRGPLERFLLVLLTVAPFSVTCAQERPQAPTLHPELIAGPWETSSPSGIDGIFFNIETSSDGPVGRFLQLHEATFDLGEIGEGGGFGFEGGDGFYEAGDGEGVADAAGAADQAKDAAFAS